jgi:hypothetical protein
MFDRTEKEVKDEPMLFSADFDYAWKKGGEITREFLLKLPDYITKRKDFIFDSRVHMLMPGWYPCIPGWHLDDVPRTRVDGQPDHENPEYQSEHAMALVGDASVTSFFSGNLELEDVSVGEGTIYKVWDEKIENILVDNPYYEVKAPTNQIIFFDCHSFHKGNPATKNGWRWFGRASWNTKREVKNEIRHQVQVYMPVPNQGW